MATAVRYRLRFDGSDPSEPLSLYRLSLLLHTKLKRHPRGKHFRIALDDAKDWGPLRSRWGVRTRMIRHLSAAKVGAFVWAKVDLPPSHVYCVRKVTVRVQTTGDRLLEWVYSQLGVRYVLGAATPGVAFDCSGLTMAGYQIVAGITLAHNADQQMNDPQVVLFHDEAKAKTGDLVFMHYGRLPEGHADHVGFWVRAGVMADTRNPVDEPVAVRAIESWAVLAFGRVPAVNGPVG